MARKKMNPDEKADWLEERRIAQAEEESSYWNAKVAGADDIVRALANRPTGRPTIYNEDKAALICELLSTGLSLNAICKRDDTPAFATITRWLEEKPLFKANYLRAREKQADAIFDECLDIADEAANDILYDDNGQAMLNNVSVQRAKLRIDTRMRIAGKLNSKYADKGAGVADVLNVTHNNLTIDARALDGEQRDKLRSLLLIAKASET